MSKTNKEAVCSREATLLKEMFQTTFLDGDGLEYLDLSQLHDIQYLMTLVKEKAAALEQKWKAQLVQTGPNREEVGDPHRR